MQRSNPAPAGAGPLIVVMGPTASGKSQLALDLARARDGVVINADAMQVYADLRIVTARPSAADQTRHHRHARLIRLRSLLPGSPG